MKKIFFLFFLMATAGGISAQGASLTVNDYRSRHSFSGEIVRVFSGDDPAFREAAFDDSRWTKVTFGTNLLSVFPGITTVAWYRLHVRFPGNPPEREMSVFLGKIYDVDEVYFNGKKIGSYGSLTPPVQHAYERDRVYAIPAPFIKPGQDNVLAVRVQGPFDGKLGIINVSPYLTATEDYNRVFFIGGFRDLAFIIVYIVIGAYFLLFFIRRPKERDYLYFGLYTLSVAAYSFLRTEFRYLVSDNFYIMKKTEYIVLYIAVALFPAYIYSFFRKKSPLPVKIYYILMMGGALTVALTDSPQFWSVFNLYAQFVFGLAFIFPFALMISQLRKNRDAKYIFFSFFLLLLGTVNDILVSRDLLHTPLLTPYLFFAVTVSLALLLANRFVRINVELEDLNVNLEKKVGERTSALDSANKELQKKQDHIDEEMKVAKRVQFTLVPQGANLPNVPGLEFSTLFLPMKDIGGDMYDIVKIDDDNYGFLIADVSGHGVPSALITTMLKAIYSYNAKPGKRISEIAASVNEEMVKLIEDIEHYYTAFFAVVDVERKMISYTNGGHHPVLMCRAATGELVHLTSNGIIGGKFADAKFSQEEQAFVSGDSFLFFTDGIVEALNPNEQFYGIRRLEEFLRGRRHLRADDFVRALDADIESFCEGRPANDDRTLLYVKVS